MFSYLLNKKYLCISIFFIKNAKCDWTVFTNPKFNKAVIRANVFKEHRQTIQAHINNII